MNRPTSCSALILAFLLSARFGWSAEAENFLIIPRERAESWGRDVGYMFSLPFFQQIYSSAEFSEAPVEVITITGMAFRWDERLTNDFQSILDVQFKMGTTSTLSTDFNQNLPNPVTVVDTNRLPFSIAANRGPSDFTLEFPFLRPFTFNRRIPWLVLQGLDDGASVDVDAEFGEGTRGWFYYQDPSFQTMRIDSLFVTKFFYTFLPQISAISKTAELIRIELTAPAGATWLLESTPDLGVAFRRRLDAVIERVSTFKLHVTVPFGPSNEFYRFIENPN